MLGIGKGQDVREYSRSRGESTVIYRGRWSSTPASQASDKGSCMEPHAHWSPVRRPESPPTNLQEEKEL